MPGYGYDKSHNSHNSHDNPHKKSKKESLSIILLDAPDRMKGDENFDMSEEDYAMSMMDDEQKKEMEMPELPVKEIMEKLGDMDLEDSQMDMIKKHLVMASKEM
tara:strand:- start:14357 stop:14668 length:312 start_codon:yes stop_codon:yes gene_type:complete